VPAIKNGHHFTTVPKKSSRASSVPQAEQISVRLSRREIAPGYAPGVSLFGMYPEHFGQVLISFTLSPFFFLVSSTAGAVESVKFSGTRWEECVRFVVVSTATRAGVYLHVGYIEETAGRALPLSVLRAFTQIFEEPQAAIRFRFRVAVAALSNATRQIKVVIHFFSFSFIVSLAARFVKRQARPVF
jgi:hypothetical protein